MAKMARPQMPNGLHSHIHLSERKVSPRAGSLELTRNNDRIQPDALVECFVVDLIREGERSKDDQKTTYDGRHHESD